jgi:Flp pilus assembly protein TadG
MSKIIRKAKRSISRMERGQIIVIVAIAAVAIIAVIGLVMDVGIIFFGNARLRRAVDSAALAAALQYRENYTTDKLTRSANEFLVLNGIQNPNSEVSNCDTDPGDPEVCGDTFQRKLVRVRVSAEVQLAFLPVLGINTAPIYAEAVSETASLSVVLVIDRSESMALGPDLSDQLDITEALRDPYYCNTHPDGVHNGSCRPFNDVLDAAKNFTNILFLPFDHLAIVTFDHEARVDLALDGNCPTNGDPCDAAHIRSDVIYPTISGLTVFEGQPVGTPLSEDNAIYATQPGASPARCYDDRAVADMNTCPRCMDDPVYSPDSNYKGLIGQKIDLCDLAHYTGDPSTYTTTNIGAGLQLAGNELANDNRQDSLWVVILLTDGVPNGGHDSSSPPNYFCPSNTWGGIDFNGDSSPLWPRCNDNNAGTRHYATYDAVNHIYIYPAEYDASDYAYDMADFVGKSSEDGGQNALIYTIGLGPEVNKYNQPTYQDPYTDLWGEGIGRIFLNYAASDDVGRGQAFYAAQPSDLAEIFRLIGTNIATRLAH